MHIYIYPLYIYNLGAVAYTRAQLNKLDCLHRKQLRQLLRIFWPNTIHNKMLYQRCRTAPISVIHIETRWKLFGHILRLPEETPARKAMSDYYTEPCFTRPGCPLRTLPGQLNKDLGLLPPNQRRLKTLQQLTRLTSVAQDRVAWRALTDTVVTAYKEKEDLKRYLSEVKRRVPTYARLHNLSPSNHTPAGMDFRNRPCKIQLTLPDPVHLPMIQE